MSKSWEKHLKEWQNHGFLTEEAAAQIRQFEQSRSSGPRLLLALTILAVFSIGLGLISLIAANWQEIPAWLKLLAYFLLMTGLAFAILRRDEKPGLVREGLIGVFILGILAGIGLIAQVFHVPSDGWRGLALWSGLSFGVMLMARSWHPVVLWQGSFTAAWVGSIMLERDYRERLDWALLTVALLSILASWKGRWTLPEPQRRMMLLIGSAFVLLLTPWLMSSYPKDSRLLDTPFLPAIGLAGLWLLVLTRSLRRSEMLAAGVVALAFFARWIICFEYSIEFSKHGANLVETIIFIVQLTAMGLLALRFQANRIFDGLTLFMALRLLILFYTLFGSLLTTGAGLIVFGLVILGLLHLWYRYRQALQSRLKDFLA